MPELNGIATCKLINAEYEEMMEVRTSDSEEEAKARDRIFKPEIICCSAYDGSIIGD